MQYFLVPTRLSVAVKLQQTQSQTSAVAQPGKETETGRKMEENRRDRESAEPKWSVLIRVYLWVLTSTLKRLSSCASRLGPESLSTKIPEEKTNTCSASKIEDTRCWWQDKGRGRRTTKKREEGKTWVTDVVKMKKWENKKEKEGGWGKGGIWEKVEGDSRLKTGKKNRAGRDSNTKRQKSEKREAYK